MHVRSAIVLSESGLDRNVKNVLQVHESSIISGDKNEDESSNDLGSRLTLVTLESRTTHSLPCHQWSGAHPEAAFCMKESLCFY